MVTLHAWKPICIRLDMFRQCSKMTDGDVCVQEQQWLLSGPWKHGRCRGAGALPRGHAGDAAPARGAPGGPAALLTAAAAALCTEHNADPGTSSLLRLCARSTTLTLAPLHCCRCGSVHGAQRRPWHLLTAAAAALCTEHNADPGTSSLLPLRLCARSTTQTLAPPHCCRCGSVHGAQRRPWHLLAAAALCTEHNADPGTSSLLPLCARSTTQTLAPPHCCRCGSVHGAQRRPWHLLTAAALCTEHNADPGTSSLLPLPLCARSTTQTLAPPHCCGSVHGAQRRPWHLLTAAALCMEPAAEHNADPAGGPRRPPRCCRCRSVHGARCGAQCGPWQGGIVRAPKAEQMQKTKRAEKQIHGRRSGGFTASGNGARGPGGFTQHCCGSAESRRAGRPRPRRGGTADRAAPCGLSPARPGSAAPAAPSALRPAGHARPGPAAPLLPPMSPRGGTKASPGPARSRCSAAFCSAAVSRLFLVGRGCGACCSLLSCCRASAARARSPQGGGMWTPKRT
ncbi:uncharacterized protein LOC129122961 isoform X1 [Agelaius phoeniceus]|uniref:uncharacterized protein LOC129122961 isoform X1 n=1 Tax=Agelaius phoeniceus TaxID=39638 RepID=UPI00405523A8